MGITLLGGIAFGGFFLFHKLKHNMKQEEDAEAYFATVQDNLPLESIRKGLVRLKDGTFLRILDVTPININLLEGGELATLFEKYKKSLKNVDFTIQILQQSRSMDMSEYFEKLENELMKTNNNFNRKQLEFYMDFVRDMVQTNSIRTKKFFVVIPYNPGYEEMTRFSPSNLLNISTNKKKKKRKVEEDDAFIKEEQFEQADRVLTSRGKIIANAISNLGTTARVLNDDELYNLFYISYNKRRSSYQNHTKTFKEYRRYGAPLYIKGGGV